MKTEMKRTSLALAVAALLASSAAFADSVVGGSTSANNSTSVDLTKSVNVSKDVSVTGTVDVSGKILVNSQSQSIVDNKQLNHDNSVTNPDPTYSATVGTAAGTGVTGNAGNIGVNAASGETNQQDNAAAISASDKSFVLGSTDSETYVQQKNWNNSVNTTGASYTSTLHSVDTNAGNVGVNVTTGAFNGQKNALAISSGVSGLAEASAATLQESFSLTTNTKAGVGPSGVVPITYTATLDSVNGNAGNVGVNLSAGNNNLQSNSLAISAVSP